LGLPPFSRRIGSSDLAAPLEERALVYIVEDLDRAEPSGQALGVEDQILLAGEGGAVIHVGSDVAVDKPHL
jgi:hypothetical protein